ncbi:MAG: RNA polymerase sigma factor [Arenicella sp.]
MKNSQIESVKQRTVSVQDSSSVESASDYSIVKRIVAGELDAYQVIMRRYNQRLFRIARSIVMDDGLAMDVVQEAHIKAYQKLTQFKGETGFAAWLSVITKNEALMQLRKLKHETAIPEREHRPNRIEDDAMNEWGNEKRSPDSVVENKQLRAQLNRYIDKLPDAFRMVFILRGVEQLTVRETAEILDLNNATVKTRYFRAKALLQKQILEHYEQNNTEIYEFGGQHCDEIVFNVMQYLHSYKS